MQHRIQVFCQPVGVVVACKGPSFVGDIQCFRTRSWDSCATAAACTSTSVRLSCRPDRDSIAVARRSRSLDRASSYVIRSCCNTHWPLTSWLTTIP